MSDTPTPNFLPHPEAERFDAVSVDTVERWKESELSGDEWRFSHVATLWHRGHIMGEVYGRSVREAMLRAAVAMTGDGEMLNESEDAEGHGMYDMLKTHCCQPGCTERWTTLLHPLKQYHDCNEMQMSDYHDDDVRGFCDEHKHRGDCDCEDADANYLDVTQRYKPSEPEEVEEGEIIPVLALPAEGDVAAAVTEMMGQAFGSRVVG